MAYEATLENPDPWPPALKMKEPSDPCTHAVYAQRFAEYFGRDLLYVDGLGWLWYDSSSWKPGRFVADRCAQELGSLIGEESIKNSLKGKQYRITMLRAATAGRQQGKDLSHPSQKADKSVTANFVRLVRITAICERHLYLDDATILAELAADDLAELKTLQNWDKQRWATLLAHRVCDERMG